MYVIRPTQLANIQFQRGCALQQANCLRFWYWILKLLRLCGILFSSYLYPFVIPGGKHTMLIIQICTHWQYYAKCGPHIIHLTINKSFYRELYHVSFAISSISRQSCCWYYCLVLNELIFLSTLIWEFRNQRHEINTSISTSIESLH